MLQHGIYKLGTIVELKLNNPNAQKSVLCTAWPDSSNCLDLYTIVVDDSVIISTNNSHQRVEWVETEFEVETRLCSSQQSINHPCIPSDF